MISHVKKQRKKFKKWKIEYKLSDTQDLGSIQITFKINLFRPPLIQRKFIKIFRGFHSYRNFSYEALWIKGMSPMESYEIPMKCLFPYKFWRNFNKRENFMEKIIWVLISPQIPVFFLWSNQTIILRFSCVLQSSVLHLNSCQNLIFFLFLHFSIPVIERGPNYLAFFFVFLFPGF